MIPEDIIREAIAYTELFIEQQGRRDIPISKRYYARRDFCETLLAVLKDEAF